MATPNAVKVAWTQAAQGFHASSAEAQRAVVARNGMGGLYTVERWEDENDGTDGRGWWVPWRTLDLGYQRDKADALGLAPVALPPFHPQYTGVDAFAVGATDAPGRIAGAVSAAAEWASSPAVLVALAAGAVLLVLVAVRR